MTESGSTTTQECLQPGSQSGPSSIIRLLGYSAYTAWVFLLFATPTYVPYGSYSVQDTTWCRLIFLAGIVTCLLIIWQIFKPSQENIYLALSFSVCPIMVLLVIVNHLVVPAPLRMIVWFICGCSVVFLLLPWSLMFAQLDYSKAPLFISLSLLIGAVFVLFALFITIAAEVIGVLLPLVSVIACKKTKCITDFNMIYQDNTKITGRYLRITWKLDCGIAAYCVCLGFSCFCICIPDFWPINVIAFFASICLGSIFSALDARKDNQIVTLTHLHKVFLLLVLLFSLPLFLLNKWALLISCIFAAFLFIFNAIVNLSGLAIGSNIYGFPPIPYSCRAKVPNVLALALGYLLAYLYMAALETGGNFLVIEICIGVGVLALAAISTFALTSSFPSDTDISDDSRKRELTTNVNGWHSWSERCNQFSDIYGFSARQRDVLKYLSRGRNAPYIAETLFISESTVKSHIYSIYKKSGIHSSQELIDRIERLGKESDHRS